ncbi:hypothetical protein M1N56_06085 [Dehalococcoidia bacterium]|nr:hypothetical protein [Dehalococcoidia bacterium]
MTRQKGMPDNWAQGVRGFQAKLDASQQKALLECWVQNDWKNQPVRTLLKESFGIELPDRTLGEYKKRLRERMGKEVDQPVDWTDFQSVSRNGIPPHLLAQLHQMAELIELLCLEGDGTLMMRVNLKPTYRSVKWWAYILQYYGLSIKSVHDRQFIAEQFATREFISESSKSQMEIEDLDKWLLYRPWESKSNESLYLSAITEGKILPLNYSKFGYGIERITNKAPFEANLTTSHMGVVSKFLELAPKPYLLPSQIWNIYAEEIDPLFNEKYLKEDALDSD